jgi:hypothetical protein
VLGACGHEENRCDGGDGEQAGGDRKPATKWRAVGWPARAPKAAMPIAPPAWRAVLLTAEASPARCGGTAPIAAATTAGVRMPSPMPHSSIAGSNVR